MRDIARRLDAMLRTMETVEGVEIAGERLARFDPVTFDATIASAMEEVAVSCNNLYAA
jgi:hypothetical protein